MSVLDQIIQNKAKEVQIQQTKISISDLQQFPLYSTPTKGFAQNIRQNPFGIIAEFKRKSPSNANINLGLNITATTQSYQDNGAAALSILTDEVYFGGNLNDLLQVRNQIQIPILRKDFIIDPYQIYQSKAYGADCILLIAAALNSNQIEEFSKLAKSLDLDILLEIHEIEELTSNLFPEIDMIGINNRNLKTMNVSIDTSKKLYPSIPDKYLKISESGIKTPADVNELMQVGFDGFLIGENFMKNDDPGTALDKFIKDLQP